MIAESLPETRGALPAGAPAAQALDELTKQLDDDLAPPGGGHWSEADWPRLLARADAMLARGIRADSSPEELRRAWAGVVTDFHRNAHWGFLPQAKRRTKPPTEGQRIFKEIFPYIWAFIQSTLIVKIAVYYFGINSAEDPSWFNLIGLGACLALSFFSLVFFAWRHHRRGGGN